MAQAPAKKTSNNLKDWQGELSQPVLPVNPMVKTAALQKLRASSGNAENIARILQNDPALCLLLMYEANKSLDQSGAETHALSHTLSLLGFPRVEALIGQAPEYDNNQFPQLAEFKQ